MRRNKGIVQVKLDVEGLPVIVVGEEFGAHEMAMTPTTEFLKILKGLLEEQLGGEFEDEFGGLIREALKNLESGMDYLKAVVKEEKE